MPKTATRGCDDHVPPGTGRMHWSAFETLTCERCGDEFVAHPDGNAPESGYCSPDCETAGKDLG